MSSIGLLHTLSGREIARVVDRRALLRAELIEALKAQGYRPMPDWLVNAYKAVTEAVARAIGGAAHYVDKTWTWKYTFAAFAFGGTALGMLPGLLSFNLVMAVVWGACGMFAGVVVGLLVGSFAEGLQERYYRSYWEVVSYDGHVAMGNAVPPAIASLAERLRRDMPGAHLMVERFARDPIFTVGHPDMQEVRCRIGCWDWWGHYIHRV